MPGPLCIGLATRRRSPSTRTEPDDAIERRLDAPRRQARPSGPVPASRATRHRLRPRVPRVPLRPTRALRARVRAPSWSPSRRPRRTATPSRTGDRRVRACEASGPPQDFSLLVEGALDVVEPGSRRSTPAPTRASSRAPPPSSTAPDGRRSACTRAHDDRLERRERASGLVTSHRLASQPKTQARFPSARHVPAPPHGQRRRPVVLRRRCRSWFNAANPRRSSTRDPTSRSPFPSHDGHSPTAAWWTTAACSRARRCRGPSSAVRRASSSPSRGAPRRRSRCPASGTFDLRLSAFDGQPSSSDVVRVTVVPEPPPASTPRTAAVREGDEGLTGASVEVRLSKPWAAPVSVDYVTQDATAANPCDYRRRFGTLEFAAGETTRSVLVPSSATTPARPTSPSNS